MEWIAIAGPGGIMLLLILVCIYQWVITILKNGAGEWTVSGNILDDADDPIENVSVSDGVRSDLTDASGDFAILKVPEGTRTLTPTLEGYEFDPVTQQVVVGEGNVTGKDFVGTAVSTSHYYQDWGDVSTGQYYSGAVDDWAIIRGADGHAYVEKTAGGAFNLHSDATEYLRFAIDDIDIDASNPTLILNITPPAAWSDSNYLAITANDGSAHDALAAGTSWNSRVIYYESSTRYSGFGGEAKTDIWNYSTPVEVKIVFDFTNHVYDVFIDGVETWSNKAFVSSSCNAITYLEIVQYTTTARDTALPDVEVP